MQATPIQHGIFDRLVATIFGIVDALLPVINAVARNPIRPWQQRFKLTQRFNRILQELLALTAAIDPKTLSPNPTFPTRPPAPPLPLSEAPGVGRRMRLYRPTVPRNPLTTPAPLFSARQLAQRLATLLYVLEALAQEAATALPAPLRHLIAQARTLAGCDALPPRYPTWERTG